MAIFACRHISITIRRPPDEVYAFIANPENLPRWAKGLSGSITEIEGEWVAESPMGKVKVRFAEAPTPSPAAGSWCSSCGW